MKSCRYRTPPVLIMVCTHGCSRPIRTSLHELIINEDQTLTSHQSFFSLFCSVLLFDTYLCCGGNSLSWEIQTFLSRVISTNSSRGDTKTFKDVSLHCSQKSPSFNFTYNFDLYFNVDLPPSRSFTAEPVSGLSQGVGRTESSYPACPFTLMRP